MIESLELRAAWRSSPRCWKPERRRAKVLRAIVAISSAGVAQVGRDRAAEFGDVQKRVLSVSELRSRQIRRGEAGLEIVVRTYATACRAAGGRL